MKIRLTGHIDVPADRLEAISAALPEHIRLTREEQGCLSFEVAPDSSVPGRFAVAELFASREDFDAHQARVKTSDWGRISEGIPRSYEIAEVAD